MLPSKKISKSTFATEAQAMSEDKGSDAPTAVIIGGGPAGMITGLALSSIGVNVRILEQLSEDAILRPALDAEGLGSDEPLIFSPKSLDHLKTWGLATRDERGQQVPPEPGAAAAALPPLVMTHGCRWLIWGRRRGGSSSATFATSAAASCAGSRSPAPSAFALPTFVRASMRCGACSAAGGSTCDTAPRSCIS